MKDKSSYLGLAMPWSAVEHLLQDLARSSAASTFTAKSGLVVNHAFRRYPPTNGASCRKGDTRAHLEHHSLYRRSLPVTIPGECAQVQVG